MLLRIKRPTRPEPLPLRERLQGIAEGRGFEGKLIVLAEAAIAPGDCRLEWADGGLARDRAQLEAAITDAVDRYLAVRRQTAA